MSLKDGSALGVKLALPDDSHSGSFESEVEPADAGK
jgi:hypothetical protein